MSPSSPWRRRVGGSVLVVLLAVLAWQAATRSVDFPIYHRVATHILHGNYELYPPEVYSGAPIPPHGWRYLPAVAFLFVPFALLPLPWAALLFFLCKLAAFAYLGHVVARWAGLPPDDLGAPVVALLLVAGYAAEEMRYGNAHLFTVALMMFAVDRAERKMVIPAAMALALAVATKVTPLALLAYFAVRREVALCAATIAALVVLSLAPAVIVGTDTNTRLLAGFARYAVQKIDESDNYSLRGVIDRALSGRAPAVTNAGAAAPAGSRPLVTWIWLATLAVLGLAMLIVLWAPPPDRLSHLLEVSLVLVVMLIASPHTQRRYFVQLYVPVLALIGVARVSAGSARLAAWTGLAATAAAGTVLPLIFGGRRLALAYESAAPYFLGAVILLGALMVLVVRMKRQPAAA